MPFTTEFENIPAHKVDDRIDALKNLIDRTLAPQIRTIQETRAQDRNLAAWYRDSDNITTLVYDAVAKGKPLDRADTEFRARTTAPAIKAEDARDFAQRVAQTMKQRPTFGQTLVAWFRGAARSDKMNFLTRLKNTGDTVQNSVASELEKARADYDATGEKGWAKMLAAKKFYEGITAAIEGGDASALRKALRADRSAPVSPAVKAALFALPVAGYTDLLSAVAAIKTQNPVEEARLVGQVMTGLGDDHLALIALRKAVDGLQDEAQAERFRKYAVGFAGQYAPFPDSAVNMNQVGYGQYNAEKKQLAVKTLNGYGWNFPMGEEDARYTLESMEARRNFMRIDDAAINVNHVGYGSFDADKQQLKIKTLNGYGWTFTMNKEKAEEVLEQLAARPGYARIEGAAINLNQVGYGSFDATKQQLAVKTLNGYGWTFDMDAAKAERVLEQLLEKPNYFRIENTAINLNQVGYGSFDAARQQLAVKTLNGYGWNFDMDGTKAEAVMQKITERPNYVRIENTVINTNQVGYGSYDATKQQLAVKTLNGYGWNFDLDAAKAEEALGLFTAKPNYQRIQNSAVNVMQVGYAHYDADKQKLAVKTLNGYGWNFDMQADEAANTLQAFKKRREFLEIEGTVMNLNRIGYGSYDEDRQKLSIKTLNGYGWTFDMDEQKAQQTLGKLRARGQRIGIAQQGADRDALQYGIQYAQRAQEDAGYRQDDTSSSLLPFLLVGAMLLYSDDSHDHVHALETMGSDDHHGLHDAFDHAAQDGLGDTHDTPDHTPDVDSQDHDFGHDTPDFDTTPDLDTHDSFDTHDTMDTTVDTGTDTFDAGSISDSGVSGMDFSQ